MQGICLLIARGYSVGYPLSFSSSLLYDLRYILQYHVP